MSSRGKNPRRAGVDLLPLVILCLGILLQGGCRATYSLQHPADWDAVVVAQPVTVALGEIADTVEADDEAFYLQEVLERKNIFYDVVLADLEHPHSFHDADVFISGTIRPYVAPRTVRPLGILATVFTGGLYGLLGGPIHEQKSTVEYTFDVGYADRAVTNRYEFFDKREATYGFYGPSIPIERKPGLYDSGWDALMYAICGDLLEERASSQ